MDGPVVQALNATTPAAANSAMSFERRICLSSRQDCLCWFAAPTPPAAAPSELTANMQAPARQGYTHKGRTRVLVYPACVAGLPLNRSVPGNSALSASAGSFAPTLAKHSEA